MRTVAVGRCKNGGYAHRRQREFASVRFDEVPTGRFYGASGGWSWCRRPTNVLRAGYDLDNDHGRAAVPANEGGSNGAGCAIGGSELGAQRRCRLMQWFTGRWDHGFAVGVGEQSISTTMLLVSSTTGSVNDVENVF